MRTLNCFRVCLLVALLAVNPAGAASPSQSKIKRMLRPLRSATVACSLLVAGSALTMQWYLTKGPEFDVFPSTAERQLLTRPLSSYRDLDSFESDLQRLAPYLLRYFQGLESRGTSSFVGPTTPADPYDGYRNILAFLAEMHLNPDPANPYLMIPNLGKEMPALDHEVQWEMERLASRRGLMLPPRTTNWENAKPAYQFWAEEFARLNDVEALETRQSIVGLLGDVVTTRTRVTLRHRWSATGLNGIQVERRLNEPFFLDEYPMTNHGPWFSSREGDVSDFLRSLTSAPLDGMRDGLRPTVRELRLQPFKAFLR